MDDAMNVSAGQGTLTPSGQNVTLRCSRKKPADPATVASAGPVVNPGSGDEPLPVIRQETLKFGRSVYISRW